MELQAEKQTVSSLLSRVQDYRRKSIAIQKALRKEPYNWGRYQSEFNQELNGVFRDILVYSRSMVDKGRSAEIDRLKIFFVENLRKYFLHGEYAIHSIKRPRGYPGDYQIIDAIYQNNPRTVGYERLFDNYFQMSAISIGVRNRKEDFKKLIRDLILNRRGKEPIRILNLASGSGRDIYELMKSPDLEDRFVFFDCVEHDQEAINFAKDLIQRPDCVRFIHKNVARMALKHNIEKAMKERYDLIYSTGLFDYLDYRLSLRLIQNMSRLLKEDGIMAISDVRNQFTNPSIYWMEWGADWNLTYRDDDIFKGIFLDVGLDEKNITSFYEQQGLFQYVIASKTPVNLQWLYATDEDQSALEAVPTLLAHHLSKSA